MRWDLFCRVIDHHGDLGVGWRLAADLAARGEAVRLWLDDASMLAWMAPQGAPGIAVVPWAEAEHAEPAEVAVELFGAEPPAPYLDRLVPGRTVWLDLEYLSAEPYVERSHGLPSPQPGGRTRWFFFPGFTPRTGGLIREPGLLERRAAFDREAWLAARGWARAPGERVVVLFCYANAALPGLLQRLGEQPTLLLAAAGLAAQQVEAALGPSLRQGALRALPLPHLPQPAFDALLWSADLNFVRGEDSLVRAIWAGAPFVWQAYVQHDGVQAAKLGALLDAAGADAGTRAFFGWWNGLGPPGPGLDALAGWPAACAAWRRRLLAQPDLVSALQGFVAARRQAVASGGRRR